MKNSKTVLLLIAILLQHLLPAHSQQKDVLVLGTYTYATNNRLSSLDALAGYLQRETGLVIKTRSFPDVPSLLKAIDDDSIQLAVMNTSGYLVFQRRHPGKAVPLLNLWLGPDTATLYGGCLIAARSTGIGNLQQLAGAKNKKLALVAKSSTSGNLVPRLLLNTVGINDASSFFDTYYAGTHRQAVLDVLEGRAALAGCGCAEVDTARARFSFDSGAVVIASFNDIPLGPLAYRSGLPVLQVKKIEQALLRMHTLDTTGFAAFCNGWTEFKKALRFQEVNDKAYDSFREMFGNNPLLWQLIE